MKKFVLPILILFAASCTKQSTMIVTSLGNDCINKTYYVPYIVGTEMLFSYAMYMPKGSGHLSEARVQCSIPGDTGSYLDNYAYTTDNYGQDLPHRMGGKCSSEFGNYCVTFDVDTIAATLRFHYVIPEEARGKKVKFNFSVKSSDGQTASFETPEYQIRKMTMKLDIPITPERCFFSLENLQAYTKAEAEEQNIPIDFLWGYSSLFKDSADRSFFGNPARTSSYSTYFTKSVPSTVRDTPNMYRYTIIEPQLGRQEFDGFYIDDRDFETLTINSNTDVLIGVLNCNGFWIETADKKYKAYVYCNSYASDGCKVSIKRYTLQ